MKHFTYAGMPYLEADARRIASRYVQNVRNSLQSYEDELEPEDIQRRVVDKDRKYDKEGKKLPLKTKIHSTLTSYRIREIGLYASVRLVDRIKLSGELMEIDIIFSMHPKLTDPYASVRKNRIYIKIPVRPIVVEVSKTRQDVSIFEVWRSNMRGIGDYLAGMIEHELVHALQKGRQGPVTPELIESRHKLLVKYIQRLESRNIPIAEVLRIMSRDRRALESVLQTARNRSYAGFMEILTSAQADLTDQYSEEESKERYYQRPSERQAWVVDIARDLLTKAPLKEYIDTPRLIETNIDVGVKRRYTKEQMNEIVSNIMRYFHKRAGLI